MREIKFLPDTGNFIKLKADNGITVTEFVELLTKEGGQFDLSKNLLTDKKSKSTFLVADGVLPDGDIVLISTVKDPKGNLTRQEVYAKIKEFIERDGDKAKEYFSQYGNYTQVANDVLENLISKYSKRKPAKGVKVKTKAANKPKKKVSKKEANELAEAKAFQRTFSPKLTR